MMGNAALDLRTVGLGPNDTIFLIGHANPHQVGDYSAEQLALVLQERHLPQNHRCIVLPSSCQVAREVDNGSLIARVTNHLNLLGYGQIGIAGAVGLAISGWEVDRVVDPAVTDTYAAAEGNVFDEQATLIYKLTGLANNVNVYSSSESISNIASEIQRLGTPVYKSLLQNTRQFLMPEGTGFESVSMTTYWLTVTFPTDVSARQIINSSLNRSPQAIKIINAGVTVPGTHWAWESGNTLRVEAATVLRPGFIHAAGSEIRFTNPDFTLSITAIRRV